MEESVYFGSLVPLFDLGILLIANRDGEIVEDGFFDVSKGVERVLEHLVVCSLLVYAGGVGGSDLRSYRILLLLLFDHNK